MVKEFLIWPIRIFLYLLTISILIFYSVSFFISTSYGKEKVKEYFFKDVLDYGSANVQPSLLGVTVTLEDFVFESTAIFSGDQVKLEFNLLNSIISQRIHLEMLDFNNGRIDRPDKLKNRNKNKIPIYIKDLNIKNLTLGRSDIANINIDNFLLENGEYGFQFTNLDLQSSENLKYISNLKGIGFFAENKFAVQIFPTSTIAELAFLEEDVEIEKLEGFIKIDAKNKFKIEKALFRASDTDFLANVRFSSIDDFKANISIKSSSDNLVELIPKKAENLQEFILENSFYSSDINVLLSIALSEGKENYSAIIDAKDSKLLFNSLNLFLPEAIAYADSARIAVNGKVLMVDNAELNNFSLTSKQSNSGNYNINTNLPNGMNINLQISSDGTLKSASSIFSNDEFKLSLNGKNLFVGISEIGVEMNFIEGLSFQNGIFRITPTAFESNIFSLNESANNFLDFDLNSMSIRNINFDLTLNKRSGNKNNFKNLSYEDLNILINDGYFSSKDAEYGGQLLFDGVGLTYSDSSFNIPALRVLSLIDIQSNLTNILSAEFEKLNQDVFIVDSFNGELYFDSVGYVNIKNFNLSFDIGEAEIQGIISSDVDNFDTFNLNLDFFSTISNSIPWYVAILGGIPAAAGAVVVTDILEDDLIQISKSSYKINGKIGDLVITSIQ